MNPDCTRIAEILRLVSRAPDHLEWKLQPLYAELHRLQQKQTYEFAQTRGWRSAHPFTFGIHSVAKQTVSRCKADEDYHPQPFGVFDHGQWFRKNRRCHAIVAHIYDWIAHRQSFTEYAEKYGVSVSTPDICSWYYPEVTTIVIYEACKKEIVVSAA
jgi:hypothetical protein